MTDIAQTVRERCGVCGGKRLTPVCEVEGFPIFQGCVPFEPEGPELAPMSWAGCETCGTVQIETLPAIETIYQGGHATGLGAAWKRHHIAFGGFLARFGVGPVLDIGGGSGSLARGYREVGGKAAWEVLEPNPLPAENLPKDIRFTYGFLNADVVAASAAQTVVFCHVLEHMSDLGDALKTLEPLKRRDGRAVIAWPILEEWVEARLAGALNFEHGIYLRLSTLEALFAAAGWELVASERYHEMRTMFLVFAPSPSDAPADWPEPEIAAADVQGFFAHFAELGERLDGALARHKGDAFVMPASIYAQFLFAAGLNETRVRGLLDNAPQKQGQRLYGTRLSAVSPIAALPRAKSPLVVINGGAHVEEMARQIHDLRPDARVFSLG